MRKSTKLLKFTILRRKVVNMVVEEKWKFRILFVLECTSATSAFSDKAFLSGWIEFWAMKIVLPLAQNTHKVGHIKSDLIELNSVPLPVRGVHKVIVQGK